TVIRIPPLEMCLSTAASDGPSCPRPPCRSDWQLTVCYRTPPAPVMTGNPDRQAPRPLESGRGAGGKHGCAFRSGKAGEIVKIYCCGKPAGGVVGADGCSASSISILAL